MKTDYSFLKILKLMLVAALFSLPMTIYAKAINLYDQPKPDAKVTETIDLSAGIIPIYTPKRSAWIKIADPKNGNVGWVKLSDLNSVSASQSVFTFTQSEGNKIPATYQIIQYGQPTKWTSEQTQGFVKKMQAEQQAMQQSIQNMMRDMDRLFYNDWQFMHHESFPFFVPVVVMPVQKTPPSAQVHKQESSSIVSAAIPEKNDVNNKIKK